MINVLPWLWIGFGYLGHMALLRNKRVFQDPQLPVGLLGKWVDLFPVPLFSVTMFKLLKDLNRYLGGEKSLLFPLPHLTS